MGNIVTCFKVTDTHTSKNKKELTECFNCKCKIPHGDYCIDCEDSVNYLRQLVIKSPFLGRLTIKCIVSEILSILLFKYLHRTCCSNCFLKDIHKTIKYCSEITNTVLNRELSKKVSRCLVCNLKKFKNAENYLF